MHRDASSEGGEPGLARRENEPTGDHTGSMVNTRDVEPGCPAGYHFRLMAQPASVPPPPPPVQTGDVVAGKYVVDREIGEGGMGVVVAAKHVELDRAVALKFMRAELRGQISTSRFMREARAAAKLQSEHVARVFDVGASRTARRSW